MKKFSFYILVIFIISSVSCEGLQEKDEKECQFYVSIQKSESITGSENKFRILTGWITNKNDYTTTLITIYVYGDNEDCARVKPANQSLKPGEKSMFSTGWISGRGPTRYEFYCD